MSITMTMMDYQQLMATLYREFSAARGLGREEGVRAMDDVVHQLTELIDRMYTEGQGLQSPLFTEREQAKASSPNEGAL